MVHRMQLTSALAWLVDEAAAVPGPDRFLAVLGERLMSDGLPLAGGALTQSAPHPIIARRVWLWRGDTGDVVEALGFGSLDPAGTGQADVGRDWLARRGTHMVQTEVAGAALAGGVADRPLLGWATARPLHKAETG